MAGFQQFKLLRRGDAGTIFKTYLIVKHYFFLGKFGFIDIEDAQTTIELHKLFWSDLPNQTFWNEFIPYIETTTKNFEEKAEYAKGLEKDQYLDLMKLGKDLLLNQKLLEIFVKKKNDWLYKFNRSGVNELFNCIETKIHSQEEIDWSKQRVKDVFDAIPTFLQFDSSKKDRMVVEKEKFQQDEEME